MTNIESDAQLERVSKFDEQILEDKLKYAEIEERDVMVHSETS